MGLLWWIFRFSGLRCGVVWYLLVLTWGVRMFGIFGIWVEFVVFGYVAEILAELALSGFCLFSASLSLKFVVLKLRFVDLVILV